MMNRPSLLASVTRPSTLGQLVCVALFVAGAQAASAQGNSPAKVSGKEYVLTKTSSFNAPPADARNPFWPIGWTPGPVVAAQAQAVVYDVKPEDFVLSTTSVDYPPLAIINGRNYAVGDAVPVATAPQEVIRVKKIMDGVVLLENRGRELRITPSFAAPKPKK